MAELSRGAASIVQAFDDRYELLGGLEENWQEDCLAAALRAAARFNPGPFVPELFGEGWDAAMEALANIAAELEGSNV
jgi:hypothetical protein